MNKHLLLEIKFGNVWLSIKAMLIICVFMAFKPGANAKYHLQSLVVEKVDLISFQDRDTLSFSSGKDYLFNLDTVDNHISFTVIDKRKFLLIQKFKPDLINIFINGVKHTAEAQSFFRNSIPTAEYFFTTSNKGHITTFPGMVFYLDKKESFFKKSFLERVIKPNYDYLSDTSH